MSQKTTAAAVDLLEVDFLNEVEAQFIADYLTCNKNDRRTVAVSFEEAVDEMQTAGAATSGHSC
jgi:hypothetical protein